MLFQSEDKFQGLSAYSKDADHANRPYGIRRIGSCGQEDGGVL